MYTREINKVLSRNLITAPFYVGCFAADCIPAANAGLHFPHCMVVNLDPSAAQGSHWIALYRPSANTVEYYDSFGIWPPPSAAIRQWLAQIDHVHFNRRQLQSINANNCGKHVIFYLYHRCLGHCMEKITEKLASFPHRPPDHIVNDFLRQSIFAN